MNLNHIQSRLQTSGIFHSNNDVDAHPSVIGYEKQFRLSWIATQMNTFIFATDLGNTPIDVPTIQTYEAAAYQFAKQNSTGWRGGFSRIAAVEILICENVSQEAEDYCKTLAGGNKWTGFSVPVIVDSRTNDIHHFDKTPMWGAIYYPYFYAVIAKLLL